MKKLIKPIVFTLIAASLIVFGGIVFPSHTSVADQGIGVQHYANPCPAGVSVSVDVSGNTSCADGSPVNPNDDTPYPTASQTPSDTTTQTPQATTPVVPNPSCTQ